MVHLGGISVSSWGISVNQGYFGNYMYRPIQIERATMFRRRPREEDYESVLFPKDEEKDSDDSSVEDTGKKEMYQKTSFVVRALQYNPLQQLYKGFHIVNLI